MRFNSAGQFVSGNGGAVSYSGTLAGGYIGTCAQWLTDTLIIANVQFPDGVWRVGAFDVTTPALGWRALDGRGANALAAGGGRWAGFTPALGVFGHINDALAGLSLQGTDQRGAGADDGTLATVANYQVGTGLQLNGVEIAPHQICRQAQVLSATTAVWDGGGNTHLGTSLPFQRMRIAGDWRVFYTPAWGIVAHPSDRPQEGRVLAQVGYHHDALLHADGRLLVGWSRGIQELPHEWVVVNALDYAITDLTESVPQEPVPAIGKPCWLGWFEFQEPLAPAPHNCLLRVKRDGLISNNSQHVGQWVQGSTVETIEQAAADVAATGLPPVAYWDAREWPRWPRLPATAWCALQAYQRANESDAAFEADLRRLITDASQRYAKVALVCQCYTSNAGNTSDLMGLPPIYARLARDFVAVTMLLVFSDEGRATGLNDHPEMRARWQELYDGITGEPPEGGVVATPNEFAVVQQVAAEHPDLLQTNTIVSCTEFTQRVLERLNADWGHVGKTAGEGQGVSVGFEPHVVDDHMITGVSYDVIFHKPSHKQVDMLGNATANEPGPWPKGPATPMWVEIDPAHYRPNNPWIEKVPLSGTPVPPDPPSGELSADIFDWDRNVRRSDQKGCLIRFDASGPFPIVADDIWLTDGGPHYPAQYPPPYPPEGSDGRYRRAIAFKPVLSGNFQIFYWVKDSHGNEFTTDGSQTVTVTE